MPLSTELSALARVLRDDPTAAPISAEDQLALLWKGAVAALEETAAAGEPSVSREAANLLRETAASHTASELREQAFRALIRLALDGSLPAVDALYRLSVEDQVMAAGQRILAQGWQPSRPELRVLFDWFQSLQDGRPFPENLLEPLTRAYFSEASPALQRRLHATAAQNEAENWAQITRAVQDDSLEAFEKLVKRYASLSAAERDLLMDLLADRAARGSPAAQQAIPILFIHQEEVRARDLALARDFLPDDAGVRALFLFLACAWDEYDALDFDRRLLTQAYESGGRALRRRLLEHSRHFGQTDWLHELDAGGESRFLGDLTDADWDLSLRRLSELEQFNDLWRLAQAAPPLWSAAILNLLNERGWTPSNGEEQEGFHHLTGLARECLAHPLELKPRLTLRSPVEVTCLALRPDGRMLAAGGTDAIIRVWDLVSLEQRDPPLSMPVPVTRALAFSQDGSLLGGASGDHRIRVFRMLGGQIVKTLEGHSAMIRALAIHPDGRTLFSASFDRTVRSWRFPSGPESRVLRAGTGEIFALALGSGGKSLLSGGADGILRVWALPEGILTNELPGTTGTAITNLAVSSSSELVASANSDGPVTLWNYASGRLVRSIGHPHGPLTALALHRNDQVLIGGAKNGEILLWNSSTGREISRLGGSQAAVSGLTLSPDGSGLFTADASGTIRAWDLTTFLAIRLPGESTGSAAQEGAGQSGRTPSERKWASFSAALARWRLRYDIEIDALPPIQVGEFDIELT